jgi:hypothetical protein
MFMSLDNHRNHRDLEKSSCIALVLRQDNLYHRIQICFKLSESERHVGIKYIIVEKEHDAFLNYFY